MATRLIDNGLDLNHPSIGGANQDPTTLPKILTIFTVSPITAHPVSLVNPFF